MSVRLTPTLKILLSAVFALFILQQTMDRYFGADLLSVLGLVPAKVLEQWAIWQLLTYSFLHGDVTHLVLNLLMLALLGGEIERALGGSRRFLLFYGFSVLFAGALYLVAQAFVVGGMFVPMVGASGGVFGLLAAYGLIYGDRTILLMFVVPMKARNAIWIFVGIEMLSLLFSPSGGLSSLAHLGGMGGGFLYLWLGAWLKARSRLASIGIGTRRRSPSGKARHLKLVEPADRDRGGSSGGHTWH